MNFQHLKLIYVGICALLCFLILAPNIMSGKFFAQSENFSELWILGPNHVAEGYPSIVSPNKLYKIYLGVGNLMGDLEYYTVYVKLGNQTEILPNNEGGLPNPLEPVFEYRLFLRDNETWEREVSFSFEQVSFEGNVSRVSRLIIDGHSVDIDEIAVWDTKGNEFYYQLFFELWIYNSTASSFEFHNRSVGLRLNMSRPL
jgi:uncharacterized membrane protein